MALAEQATTDPPGFPATSVYVSILVDVRSEATVHDQHHPGRDIVSIRFDSCGDATHPTIQGDLATVSRIVDDIAHQLVLVSTRRAEAEEAEDDRARGLAGVALCRDAAEEARATA